MCKCSAEMMFGNVFVFGMLHSGTKRQRHGREQNKMMGQYELLHKVKHAVRLKSWRDKKRRNEELLLNSAQKKK